MMLHAANSAGALYHPATRLDMVRCGVALYGLAPSAEMDGRQPTARPPSGPVAAGPGLLCEGGGRR